MGMTFVIMEIANPKKPQVHEKIKLLVDSGALYSVIPCELAKKLGLKSYAQETLFLANGEEINRAIADAVFFYLDKRGPSKVIIGEPGDTALLGVVTLESLGYALDPLRRELKPLKMLLV